MQTFLRDALGSPVFCADIFERLLKDKAARSRRLLLFICAGAMWAIWKTRNDMVFNDKLVASPTVVVHKMMGQLKYWKPMQKRIDAEKTEESINKIMAAVGALE